MRSWALRLTFVSVAAVVMGACSNAGSAASGPSVEIRAVGCAGATPSVGSGTAIGANLVVTAAHVIAGGRTIEVVHDGGVVTASAVVGVDVNRDLAVLSVPSLDAPKLAIRDLDVGASGVLHGAGDDGRAVSFTVERLVNLSFADDESNHMTRPGYELRSDTVQGDSGAGLIIDGVFGGLVFASSEQQERRAWATRTAPVLELLAAVERGQATTHAGPCQ